MAHHHHVNHTHLFIGELILLQLTEALIRVKVHVARARLQVTTEDLHKGRFATTVGTDKAIAIAIAKLDGNVFEQRLAAELHGDVVGRKQDLAPAGEGEWWPLGLRTREPRPINENRRHSSDLAHKVQSREGKLVVASRTRNSFGRLLRHFYLDPLDFYQCP